MLGVDARMTILVVAELADQNVDDPVPGQMAAGQQHVLRAQRQEHFGDVHRDPRGRAPERPVSASASGQVGRHEEGPQREPALQRIRSRAVEQRRPILGEHDRIDDDRNIACQRRFEHIDNRLDDLRAREHADLDDIGPDILEHHPHLQGDEEAGTGWVANTPRVFCAVSAVTAVVA